jgi:cobalt/nickel transport protein
VKKSAVKKSTVNVLLVLALVVIFVVSFAIGGKYTDAEERFPGTDGTATEQIEELNPEYEPWFAPFFESESSEVESGLFAMQAGIGGIVLGFAFGALWGRRNPARPSAVEGDASEGDPSPVGEETA